MKRALLILVAACSGASPIPEQPIAFDHQLHLRLDLDGQRLRCTDCHAGAERSEHAGLPAMRDCLRCHVRPQGPGTISEAKVRALAAAGPVHWVQVTRNPGHVYAPHLAHVGIAKLPCVECHGDVATWSRPPAEPTDRLRHMDECISCHRSHDAPTTCGTCHR